MTTKTIDNQPETKATGHTTAGLPALTRQEREVLTEYLQKDHMGALPHSHVDTEITSTGEKAFNLITYKGIGWLTNAAISVYLTEKLIHGNGKKHMGDIEKKLIPLFEKLPFLSDQAAKQAAHSSLYFAGLSTGGFALLYPIKKLEEYKPEIVEFLDKKYNQVFSPTKTDLVIQDSAHERLKNEPKPNWGNILLGRMLGVGTVFGVVVGIGRGRDERALSKVAEKTAEILKESKSSTLNALGSSGRAKRMFGISLMEIYTSFIAEEVLYLTTRMYKNMKRKELIEASNDNLATAPIISQPVESLAHEPEDMAQTSTFADRVTRNAIASDRALDQPPVESYTDKVIEMRQGANQLSRGGAA